MIKPRCLNLYAGPGTGKSTTCAALFAELKYLGHNVEMILEYAKDAAWEQRGPKFFRAQDLIFGKQHFRLSRVAEEVEFIITDSPLLLSLVYMPEDFNIPSLRQVIKDAYNNYENLDIFLNRSVEKPYNPKGRNQTEDEAKEIDGKIRRMLFDTIQGEWVDLTFGKHNIEQIVRILKEKEWIN